MDSDKNRDDDPTLEYEPNPEDERVEPLVEDDEFVAPPPTLDPEERVEQPEPEGTLPNDLRPI